MLSAVATVLMAFSFSVPLMPSFIKMDFSELPALLAAFALGPGWGVAVCLVKNLINLIMTTTGGVGELANFLIGAMFALTAGWIYRVKKTRTGALIASVSGALAMGVMSIPINYFISYPFYTHFMPLDVIIGMYQAIFPKVNGLLACLLIFNFPFTVIKGLLDAAICFLIYKPLSPILKGVRK
jgi:riboflavin transporter FmnP